jgi:hypothetical protein
MTLKAKRLSLTLTLATIFVTPGFAQFEVAPDHFDEATSSSTSTTTVQRQALSSTHISVRTARVSRALGISQTESSATKAAYLKQQISKQQSALADYNARLAAQSSAVEAAWQNLTVPQLEDAGQVDALRFEQVQLDDLQKSLAPRIKHCELALAQLQSELESAIASPQTALRPNLTNTSVKMKQNNAPHSEAKLISAVQVIATK